MKNENNFNNKYDSCLVRAKNQKSFLFSDFENETEISFIDTEQSLPVYKNEFWTSKQRTGHSIQDISYRGCFKPQLVDYFIDLLCKPGFIIYDPFMGRGTTLIQAQLRGFKSIGNDINPISRIFAGPRLNPPAIEDVKNRLETMNLKCSIESNEDLLVFFHPDTLSEIAGLREYFKIKRDNSDFDKIDAWIEMVACNRLTGHSKGFFSVYTMPPNQAVSIKSQQKINEKRNQKPEYRDVKKLILRKSQQLLSDKFPDFYTNFNPLLLCKSADNTPEIESSSVELIITSPPFLDTVNYLQDNWMRLWFCDLKLDEQKLWQIKKIEDWENKITSSFKEFSRILKENGVIAFEVGEVRKGTVNLETIVIRAAKNAGLTPKSIIINSQKFTKTANCWGVKNNEKGTNTNRIVVIEKK